MAVARPPAHSKTESSLAPDCVLCGTPLDGPIAPIFRLVGIGRSARNPNLCTRCNVHAEGGRVAEITVIFADLTSFTELTQALGPERVHQVVDAFLRMASAAIARHDGLVDTYAGDAVMAMFNVPIRRSDHAAQAVAAGLAIQDELPGLSAALGIELRAAVGVARGWARVGTVGVAHGRDYTAIGDVVNLAARLEGAAHPGEMLVDDQVYADVSDQFPASAREELTLKGFREAVGVYRLASSAFTPNTAPPSPTATLPRRSRLARLRAGSIVFALLGAPCAAAVLIGPVAIALGVGGVFAAGSAFWLIEEPILRVPMLALATLGALANLYTAWHARDLRRHDRHTGRFQAVTRLERRRGITIVLLAIATLVWVGFEFYSATALMGHRFP